VPSRAGSRPRGGNRPSGRGGAARRRVAQAQRRRHRQLLIAGAAIGLVIAVVAVFIIVKATGGGTSTSHLTAAEENARTPVPAALYNRYTTATPAALAAAAKNFDTKFPGPTTIAGSPLTTTGKPELLYMGAEYCPYCATERWAVVLALSKFGTFSGLSEIHSSPTDVYASTATWSFYGSHYSSPYLTFTPVEEETVSEQPLQTPTAAQAALLKKYTTGFPFLYFNGKATITSVGYNPQLLHGLSFSQIVASVSGGTSTLASNVYSAAGAITAQLCRMTGDKPAAVCRAFGS
jgi:thiol-disulfide isomerase/thioredoxin